VLATGSWPLQSPTCEFTVPRDVAPLQASFEKFYMEQHSGRKLLWYPQLSKGEVKTHYLSNTYTLQCSAYQIGVLLMFEDRDSFSLQEISIATQLRDEALKNALYALVKTRTLTMDPAPASTSDPIIADDASFALNRKFSSKRLKVNINISNKGAKKKETLTVNKEISEDRKLAIQACIVRIMKSRKRLPHAQLITEVVSQLNQRFKPKVPLIKKCVDVLLDKEYLRRAENSVNEYEYVA
jgi:cullin 1